jgi:hypothetical protein
VSALSVIVESALVGGSGDRSSGALIDVAVGVGTGAVVDEVHIGEVAGSNTAGDTPDDGSGDGTDDGTGDKYGGFLWRGKFDNC